MTEHCPWRKRCPRGHSNVHRRQRDGKYRCDGCRERDDIETYYYSPDEITIYDPD